MNANTFLTLSTEAQNELLEESRREGWFFETEHGALDADAMEEWLLATINHRGTVGWHKDAIRPCAGCTHNDPCRCPVAATGHDMNGMEWNGLCAYLPE